MASTSYTENLGLCAWLATDRPKRMDFVNDNSIIDNKLGGHIKDSDIHVTAEEKARFNTPYTVFSYAGNGDPVKTFALNESYTFGIIFQKYYPPVQVDSNNNTIVRFAVFGRTFGSSSDISMTNTSFTVRQDTTATDGVKNNFNEAEGQYVVLLFK